MRPLVDEDRLVYRGVGIMVGSGVLLFCVVVTMLIAQFSPLVALLVSIGLCVSEVVWLWLGEVERVNKMS